MAKYPRNKFLPDKLEYLMRIGLVDRSKLQQYKLAFKDPDNNVRFQHYRPKILEVFYKIFEIVADNDPIFMKVRQEVQRRYRNQKPMKKKKLDEATMPRHQKNINAFRRDLEKWELNSPEKVHATHNELQKGKPEGMHHREYIAKRVMTVAAVGRLKKAKSAETQKVLSMIDKASKEIKPLDHSKLPILGPDKFPSKPKPKPPSREDEIQKAYERAHTNAGYDVGQGKVKLKKGMSKADHQHAEGMKAANAVARKHKELDDLKAGKTPEAPKKKPSLASRLLSRLTGKKSVSEGLSMSGGRAHLQSKSSGSKEVERDRSELMADKAKARQVQNQAQSTANRVRTVGIQTNKANRGKPTT